MLFLKQKETNKPITIEVFVNSSPSCEIKSADIQCIQQCEIESNNCKFNIYAFLEKQKTGIEIFYCANNLAVKAFSFPSSLKERYLFAVTSDYFDLKANPERTKFNFDLDDELEQQDILNPKPNKNFEDLIKKTCFEIIRNREPNIVKENKARLEEFKQKYGYINVNDVDVNTISFSAKEILNGFREKRNQEEDNLVKLLENENASPEQIAEKVSEQNKHELAKYIFHRNLIVKTGLKLMGSNENEKILDKLFFPQNTSFNCDNDEGKPDLSVNNIWLIDDKFISFNYIASDVTMKRIVNEINEGEPEGNSVNRPDLFMLFNKPEKSAEHKDVILIELKKGNIDIIEQLKAIDQVSRYKRAIQNSLSNINSFYCYVICDFDANDAELEEDLINKGFIKVFSNQGYTYYNFLKGSKAHLTYISLENIFNDAKARNETSLNILTCKANPNKETSENTP